MEEYNPKPRYFNVNVQPKIGENCSLVDVLLDCNDLITIGSNVAFGHGVMVLTGYHEMYLEGKGRMESIESAPVVIQDGVWIASGCIICPGVTIGKNAVIGAGAVVTKDVPANEFWAGGPAKFVKTI